MPPFPMMPLGPGSQPREPDGAEPSYIAMPSGMRGYEPPSAALIDRAHACPRGLRLLELLLARLRGYGFREASRALDLLELPDGDRELVGQSLGEGEVSIRFAREPGLRIQETRLAGVWRLRAVDPTGRVTIDEIEVADIPARVREIAFAEAGGRIELDGTMPDGVLTGRVVLAEVSERSSTWRRGDDPHVVNLTLLPHSPQDLAYLDQHLGGGAVSLLSRGYGACRIESTGLRHCWRVRHFNSDDRLILDTLEVVDVPAAALAAQEDIEDSAERLADILAAVS